MEGKEDPIESTPPTLDPLLIQGLKNYLISIVPIILNGSQQIFTQSLELKEAEVRFIYTYG
jgi:hypothetical protein